MHAGLDFPGPLGTPILAGFRKPPPLNVIRRYPDQIRKSWYVLFQQLPGLPERVADRVIPKLWRDWCPPGYDASTDLEHLWAALPDRAHRHAAISYYRYQFQPRRQPQAYRSWHYTWRDEPLRTPILLLHGDIDGGLDLALATASAQDLPPGSKHEIIRGAGHFMHLDQPGSVARLIGEYISEDRFRPLG